MSGTSGRREATTVGEAAGRRETLTVEDERPERLDTWLARRLELSRTRAARLVEQGLVQVDGRAARKSAPVAAGQRVEVEIPPPEPVDLVPEDIPLAVVHEDDALLVVDKPAGLVVHPAPGHPRGTLVNALLHHVADLAGVGGRMRPGIVHRLDRDTSGLLVVAKNDAAHRALSAELAARKVGRTYLAAAWGHLRDTPLTVDAPIGRDPRARQRMAVVEGGRRAVTHLAVRERWEAAELLEVRLETGRTHQIRVHLAHIGHPVVGDPVYGAGRERGVAGPARRWAKEVARRTGRQFLHACALSFTHPLLGTRMRFRSPLPADLAGVAEWARTHRGSR